MRGRISKAPDTVRIRTLILMASQRSSQSMAVAKVGNAAPFYRGHSKATMGSLDPVQIHKQKITFIYA